MRCLCVCVFVCLCVCASDLYHFLPSSFPAFSVKSGSVAVCWLVRAVIDWASVAGQRPPALFICYTFIVHNPSGRTSSHPISFFIILLCEMAHFSWFSDWLFLSAVYNWPPVSRWERSHVFIISDAANRALISLSCIIIDAKPSNITFTINSIKWLMKQFLRLYVVIIEEEGDIAVVQLKYNACFAF